MRDYISTVDRDEFIAIEPVEEKEYYPMSSAQKRLYILQQMDESSTAYNTPNVVEIVGEIDIEMFESAFRAVIRRHESLRTSFMMLEDKPVQKILPARNIDFHIEYLELDSANDGSQVGADETSLVKRLFNPI